MLAVIPVLAGTLSLSGQAGASVSAMPTAVRAAAPSAVPAAGGLTWSAARDIDPAHIGIPGDVSCVSTTFCGAVEYNSVLTYNGRSWSKPVVAIPGKHRRGP